MGAHAAQKWQGAAALPMSVVTSPALVPTAIPLCCGHMAYYVHRGAPVAPFAQLS